MNKIEMLERINRAADENNQKKAREAEYERKRRTAIVCAVKKLAPRIADMLDIAQHLYNKNIPIGKKRTLSGMQHSDEFISSWWSHNLGFCYDSCKRPRVEYPMWFGFINGGACGEDMCVDREGNIVKGHHKYGDMQRMLERFDEFERMFYDYVESL